VLSNWAFLIGVAAAFVAAFALAATRSRTAGEEPAAPAVDDLDWVGITVPWTAEHLARMDAALALDDLVLDHPPPVGAAASRAAAVSAVRLADRGLPADREVDVGRP
jgi:hypothetical protein